MRKQLIHVLVLSWVGCSGVPSDLPIIEEPSTSPQTRAVPLEAPRFIVSRDAFGPVKLGMTQQEFIRVLPLYLRLVLGGDLPDGLAGEVFTITDEEDKPLFRAGLVDGQIAWLLADNAGSGVGASQGAGFGSSLSFVKENLGTDKIFPLPNDTTKWIEFTEFPNTRFSFGATEELEKILLVRESLLPNTNISMRGIVLPGSRVSFFDGGSRHEAKVSTAASLPAVGAMMEGEGVRQSSGVIKCTRQFAVNPSAKDVPTSLQDRVRTDDDFLSYVSLLAVRDQIVGYRVEALPPAVGEVAGVVSALVIFTSPVGDGYSKLRLLSADGPLEIAPAVFGVDRATYLEAP